MGVYAIFCAKAKVSAETYQAYYGGDDGVCTVSDTAFGVLFLRYVTVFVLHSVYNNAVGFADTYNLANNFSVI